MGNSLRCCLACVLPCGALDLIRIVHLNGYVEEISNRGVTAAEILNSYPNHVLSKPSSQGMVRKILILSPHTELKRGGIYFLIPNSLEHHLHLPNNSNKTTPATTLSSSSACSKSMNHDHKPKQLIDHVDDDGQNKCPDNMDYLSSTLDRDEDSKKGVLVLGVHCEAKSKAVKSQNRHQRRRSSRGKSGVWHPHLHAITED